MESSKLLFTQIGRAIPDTQLLSMFGYPCYAIERKPFIFFEMRTKEDMIFRLSGEVRDEALSLENAKLFNPAKHRKPMRNWVQIPIQHQALWTYFAGQALINLLNELNLKK